MLVFGDAIVFVSIPGMLWRDSLIISMGNSSMLWLFVECARWDDAKKSLGVLWTKCALGFFSTKCLGPRFQMSLTSLPHKFGDDESNMC